MTEMPIDFNEIEPPIPPKPFAGRQDVFARLQQYLVDPTDRHALLFLGREAIGKTALLQRCDYIFGENFINCYFPLTAKSITNEDSWLRDLVHHTNAILELYDFNTTRLPALPDVEQSIRDWLYEDYLSEVFKLLRPHRRLLWLFDDAEHIISAIDNDILFSDCLPFLYQVLQAHTQLGMVLTLNEDYESQVNSLTPLVDMSRIQRLQNLDEDASADLMLQFIAGISPDANQLIYEQTAGDPYLLQQIGTALQNNPVNPITRKDVEKVIQKISPTIQATYRAIWQNHLSQNERFVLTALSSLLYADPIGNINTQKIEAWLIETDFPLDITTINAAIRGLEYRELLIGSTAEGIRLRPKLFQHWLIEHARLEQGDKAVLGNLGGTPSRIAGIGLLVGLIIAIIILLALTQTPQSDNSAVASPHPTVTLEQADG